MIANGKMEMPHRFLTRSMFHQDDEILRLPVRRNYTPQFLDKVFQPVNLKVKLMLQPVVHIDDPVLRIFPEGLPVFF